jgi:hypothetical protein
MSILAQAAQTVQESQANIRDLTASITAAVGLVVAVFGVWTIFIKRKWDIQDDERRWERERAERRREELKAAFASYLAARDAVENLISRPTETTVTTQDLVMVINTLSREGIRLRVLLEESDQSLMSDDIEMMMDWAQQNKNLDEPAQIPIAPLDADVQLLVRRLLHF